MRSPMGQGRNCRAHPPPGPRLRSQPVLPRRAAPRYRSCMDSRHLPPGRPVPRIAWLGDPGVEELALARGQAEALAEVIDADGPWPEPPPALVVLAAHGPARWTLVEAAAVSRRWPLAPLVACVTSLADGRRRSGPWLPGVEEVAWHDFAGRLAWWFTDRIAGRAGSLGLPATARREERHADSAARVRSVVSLAGPPPSVAVAGGCRTSLEGTADLVAAAGFPVVGLTRGRPRLDERADVVVWDTAAPAGTDLAWLGMLAANRPGLGIVLLDSFPRGDAVRAALRAGAAAVLGRPAGLEALAGTLLRLKNRSDTAIGAAGSAG